MTPSQANRLKNLSTDIAASMLVNAISKTNERVINDETFLPRGSELRCITLLHQILDEVIKNGVEDGSEEFPAAPAQPSKEIEKLLSKGPAKVVAEPLASTPFQKPSTPSIPADVMQALPSAKSLGVETPPFDDGKEHSAEEVAARERDFNEMLGMLVFLIRAGQKEEVALMRHVAEVSYPKANINAILNDLSERGLLGPDKRPKSA